MPENKIRSGADGVYELSYFGSSVRHSLRNSQDVYGRLSGKGRLSEHEAEWTTATEEYRSAYLLEEHENAHHRLLYGCPAGVLYWRLLQVLHRDISHFSNAKAMVDVEIPVNRTPADFFRSGDFFRYLIKIGGGHLSDFSYPQGVIEAIDKVVLLIDILFHHNPKARFSNLTVSELLELLNDVFLWLAARCDITISEKWVSYLPGSEKVFIPGRDFNCMGLAEVHACAHELYLLRAFRDLVGFRRREKAFLDDQFGACFEAVREYVRFDNEVGYDPRERRGYKTLFLRSLRRSGAARGSSLRRRGVDCRVNPRILVRGQDGRGSEASRKQPTNS
jgi:hypothetical protein